MFVEKTRSRFEGNYEKVSYFLQEINRIDSSPEQVYLAPNTSV